MNNEYDTHKCPTAAAMPVVPRCFVSGLYKPPHVRKEARIENSRDGRPFEKCLDGLSRIQNRRHSVVGKNVRFHLLENVVARERPKDTS